MSTSHYIGLGIASLRGSVDKSQGLVFGTLQGGQLCHWRSGMV